MSDPSPACHPGRDHYALGYCLPCYHRYYRQARKALGRPTASNLSIRQRKVALSGR